MGIFDLKMRKTAAVLIILLFTSSRLAAAITITQSLAVAVSEIYVISVGSPSVSLTLSTPSAGSDFSPQTNAMTSYNISLNSTTVRKITASLRSSLPTGITLAVALAAPSEGSSSGSVNLTTSAQDVVRGLSQLSGSGLVITYTLSALLAQSAVGSNTNVVTYTLIAQ